MLSSSSSLSLLINGIAVKRLSCRYGIGYRIKSISFLPLSDFRFKDFDVLEPLFFQMREEAALKRGTMRGRFALHFQR
jgi:hypothetical protein